MKRSNEEKQGCLMAEAEKVVDEYLEWEESHPRPDLTAIEDIALKLRKAIGEEIAQMVIEEQEERLPVPGPRCGKCGWEMRYKGEKEVGVESRVGFLKIERGYYLCPECKESIFPPG
jgi:predicted Zn-ribbon and HTH transcriptional regulator